MDYMARVRLNLVGDGCEVSDEPVGEHRTLIGYKAQTKALAKSHIFVAVSEREFVDMTAMQAYTMSILRLADSRKGQWRGLQSNVLVMPIALSSVVKSDVESMMRRPFRLSFNGFAAMAQPVVVDMAAMVVLTFRGKRIWGYAYNGLIRNKLDLYVINPMRQQDQTTS